MSEEQVVDNKGEMSLTETSVKLGEDGYWTAITKMEQRVTRDLIHWVVRSKTIKSIDKSPMGALKTAATAMQRYLADCGGSLFLPEKFDGEESLLVEGLDNVPNKDNQNT
jgi:hypothetical protein